MQKPPLTRIVLLAILLLSAVFFAINQKPLTINESQTGSQNQQQNTQQVTTPGNPVDDWQFKPGQTEYDNYGRGGINAPTGAVNKTSMPLAMEAAAPMAGAGNIGYSVGGAKDINNFRENIKNDYLPLPTDVTYEGLFYDYYFDTGANMPCDKLFCPSYSYAVSQDPISEKDEYYLSVGLNSGIKESDFQRKKLNLIIVLDISGSMGSPFDQYYYDRFGNRQSYLAADKESISKKKIEIASKSIVALLDHLNPDDRFGMVVFDDYAELAKPMGLVKNTDLKKIKDHILELEERGGTNLSEGMDLGTRQFKEFMQADQSQYENRIIFLTDAQPNLGDTSDEGMLNQVEDNAKNNIYTTFIGIGVDFNTELIEVLTKVRGANYYSVHSSKEFSDRMDEGFDYMVTPLVFDLRLNLTSSGYAIDKVYGSPEADQATGEIMYVNTLFPSKTEGGQTKGGVVLIKLHKTTSEDNTLNLKVSYEDRLGKKDSSEVTINIPTSQNEIYQNTGIRKAILLSRYANLLKDWLVDQRMRSQPVEPVPYPYPGRPIPMEKNIPSSATVPSATTGSATAAPGAISGSTGTTVASAPGVISSPVQKNIAHPCLLVTREYGIVVPEERFMPPCWPYPWPVLGEWERQSIPLTVDRDYRNLFDDFSKYFATEMKALNDPDLQQELDILKKLAS